MSRVLRALTTTTALAVAAAMIPATAGAAPTPTTTDRSPAPVSATAPTGVTIGGTAVSSTDFVATEATASRSGTTASRATTWPVGGGKADLTTHNVTPSGAAAQQFSSVKLRHYRAHGGVFEATVKLRGTPSSTTQSVILLAFGKLNSARTVCNASANTNIVFNSTGTGSQPDYQGSTIKVRPFKFPAARTATWNCAFAKSAPTRDELTTNPYDSLTGRASLYRQKPILSIRVSNRRISSQAYTTIPVTIVNSTDTVATAYGTRLGVTAKGLSVRFDPAVGTIRPGASRKGSIKMKYTSRYSGYFIITVRSGDYVKKVKYTVTPVRS